MLMFVIGFIFGNDNCSLYGAIANLSQGTSDVFIVSINIYCMALTLNNRSAKLLNLTDIFVNLLMMV